MSAPRELIRLASKAKERAQLTYEPDDLDRAVAARESAVVATDDGTVDVSQASYVLRAAGALLRKVNL